MARPTSPESDRQRGGSVSVLKIRSNFFGFFLFSMKFFWNFGCEDRVAIFAGEDRFAIS